MTRQHPKIQIALRDNVPSQLDPRSATFTPDLAKLGSMAMDLDAIHAEMNHGVNMDDLTAMPDIKVSGFFAPGKVVYITAPCLCVEHADGPVLKPLHEGKSLPVYEYTLPSRLNSTGFDRKSQMPGSTTPLGFRENPCEPPVFVCSATEAVSNPVGPHRLPHYWHQGERQSKDFHKPMPYQHLCSVPLCVETPAATPSSHDTGEQPSTPDSVVFEDYRVFLRGADLMNNHH
ncbi:hypothetical protein ACHAQH_001287 [Verticillium albo-atrum]